MISVENLQLHIDGKEILNGIELHLQPGDIYGLLGPNGAGKSTTMLALLGLRERSGGHIGVLGKDPADHALEIRRNVGVMPERSGFYDWMTAPAYLQLCSELYGKEQKEFNALLESVGLGSARHRCIATFSRGMKQRLAVARALAHHPTLLILDEPTNGLDPNGRREIHDLLLNFSANRRTGVLLCTHLLDDVERLCNKIGIVDQGRTKCEGGLREVLTSQLAGQCYRLRMEQPPDTSDLPPGLCLLANDGKCLKVQLQPAAGLTVSDYWAELWRRGWRILEISSEATNLEQLYSSFTAQAVINTQEAES